MIRDSIKKMQKLKDSLTPQVLAWGISIGLVGGIFPIPGLTLFVGVFLSHLLNANQASSTLTNIIVTPLNFATFIPFIKLGEWIFNQQPQELSQLLVKFQENPFETLTTSFQSIICGIFAWAILSPFLILFLYQIFYVIILIFQKNK